MKTEYTKNECSMHGYLIHNILTEQEIKKKTRNSKIVFHNEFISLINFH